MKSCMKNGKPPFINGWRSRSSDLLPLEPSRQVGEAVGVDCVVKSEMKKCPFIFAVIYLLFYWKLFHSSFTSSFTFVFHPLHSTLPTRMFCALEKTFFIFHFIFHLELGLQKKTKPSRQNPFSNRRDPFPFRLFRSAKVGYVFVGLAVHPGAICYTSVT